MLWWALEHSLCMPSGAGRWRHVESRAKKSLCESSCSWGFWCHKVPRSWNCGNVFQTSLLLPLKSRKSSLKHHKILWVCLEVLKWQKRKSSTFTEIVVIYANNKTDQNTLHIKSSNYVFLRWKREIWRLLWKFLYTKDFPSFCDKLGPPVRTPVPHKITNHIVLRYM